MTLDQLRKVHRMLPFRPFVVHLADGREIRVPHPEFMAFPKDATEKFALAGIGEDYEVFEVNSVVSCDIADDKSPRRPCC